MQVEGVGPVTYTQAAGFLKIPASENPLDRTWVHPESYPVAIRVLEKLGFTPEVIRNRDELPALHAKMNEADLPALAQGARGRRADAARHLRRPGPPRARPARRPAQADLQAGGPQARRPHAGDGAEGDRAQRRRLRRLRRHRPEGLGPGPHQPARQPLHQEPARRGERRRRGDGLGHGGRRRAEAGLADDGQAGHGASSGQSRRRGWPAEAPASPAAGASDARKAVRAVPRAAKARRLPSPPARASRWETPRRGGPIVPRAEAGKGPAAVAPAARVATRGGRAAAVLATSTGAGPARGGSRARTGAVRSDPAPSPPRPSRQARASAAPAVEGRVGRFRPAPDLRPAQAVVAGSRR